jgi:hypothetical protein
MDTQLKKHIEDVKYDGLLLKDLPKEYRTNKQVVKAAIVKKFKDYYWDDKLYTVKMFEVLKAFEYADESLRNDKKFVLQLIEKCSGYLFQYLPDILKNDEDVFLKSIKHTGIDYVYSELYKCENKNFSVDGTIYSIGLKDCLLNMSIVEFASPKIFSNKEIMMVAIEQEPASIHYADHVLKNDEDIVRAAVSRWGYWIKYASERLRDDMNVVLDAISATCKENLMEDFTGEEYWGESAHMEWEYISERLKHNPNLYLEIINNGKKFYKGEFVLNLAPEIIKDNEALVLAAVKINKAVLKFASKRLQEKFSNL